jgi:hypothetical protein
MNETRKTARIIPLPDGRCWSLIARKYVDHMLSEDPRAAFFYLEHQLDVLKLSKPPPALQAAVDQEYRKRGFRNPVRNDRVSGEKRPDIIPPGPDS